MPMRRGILIIIYNWRMQWISPFNLILGGDVRENVSGEETPIHLYLFAFTSGMRKEEVNDNNKEEKKFLISLTVNS